MPARTAKGEWEGTLKEGVGTVALALSELGHPPTRIDTTARVGIEKAADGFVIPRIELKTEATVPGIDTEGFRKEAEKAKAGCPVSKALAATEITLEARLSS